MKEKEPTIGQGEQTFLVNFAVKGCGEPIKMFHVLKCLSSRVTSSFEEKVLISYITTIAFIIMSTTISGSAHHTTMQTINTTINGMYHGPITPTTGDFPVSPPSLAFFQNFT